MRLLKIGNSYIGDFYPTYIIAEIGGNFLNLKEARKLIDLACEAGANAVKLQTYRAETISSKSAMYDMPNTGHVRQFDLFKKYEVDFDLHKDIWDYCREKGIFIFSTPSHVTDIDLLEKLGCAAYKIGSDDVANIPFLKEVASIGKPIIMSTGMCTMDEVRESVSAILSKGNQDLVLLHCVTNYPADPVDANLRVIPEMKKEFGLPVGYSDHTIGNLCCFGAVAVGANAIEKHFTYDKNAEGPDHMLSADPAEFRQLVSSIRILEDAMGDGVKHPSRGEKSTRINNRKSVIAVKDISQGTVISKDMVAIKRPGFGIQPKYVQQVVGGIARVDIKAEEPILWEQVMKQKEVRVNKFCAPSGENEYFVFVENKADLPFEEQLKGIERKYLDALKMLDIDEDTVVFRKFFLSDIVNQMPALKQSCLYGEPVNSIKVAVSAIQQAPMAPSKIAMFAYHATSKKEINKAAISKQCLLVKRSHISQLWFTNLAGSIAGRTGGISSSEQTRHIFERLIKELARYNASLRGNVVRTWLYVKDIDKNYQGVVDQRRKVFYQQGLTMDSHFIASTGINGEGPDPNALVSMDALSLLGVKEEQISYLNAPGKLCRTINYNVTFERGVKVSYSDRAHLYISGTASINKSGKVLYKGNIIKQTARIFENIDALLRNGNASLKDLMYIIIYLRNPDDAGFVERYISDMADNIPYIIVHAPVCRSEWLVEIEGQAIIKHREGKLPGF